MFKPLLKCAAASLAVIMLSGTAQAAALCKVTDPTNTPLNLRDSENGDIIGKLRNGKLVYVLDYSMDYKGRPWAYIATSIIVR